MASPQMSVCLWFDNQAEDAAKYYMSIFKNAKLGRVTHYGKAGFEVHGRPEGSVLTVEFELNGMRFTALNGGPVFTFNEAVSIEVHCDTQAEVDEYWEKLGAGGDPTAQQCGWLKDKYGLSWQIVPKGLNELVTEESDKGQRAMAAMLKMKKLDLAAVRQAYEGK